MPRQRDDVPLTTEQHTRHLAPYTAHTAEDGHEKTPKADEWIPIANDNDVAGFYVKTSSGPSWRALDVAGDERKMRVVRAKRNQEFKGLKHVTELECDLPGYDFPVLAYFKGGQRVA